MKREVTLGAAATFLLLLLLSCSGPSAPEVTAPEVTKADIAPFFSKLDGIAAARNAEELISYYADDAVLVIYSKGPDDKVEQEFDRKTFSEMMAANFGKTLEYSSERDFLLIAPGRKRSELIVESMLVETIRSVDQTIKSTSRNLYRLMPDERGYLIRSHTAEMIDIQVIPVALPKPEAGEELEKDGESDAMEPASVMSAEKPKAEGESDAVEPAKVMPGS